MIRSGGDSKPGATDPEPAMLAIATIFVFLAIIVAFNVFEFGRID